MKQIIKNAPFNSKKAQGNHTAKSNACDCDVYFEDASGVVRETRVFKNVSYNDMVNLCHTLNAGRAKKTDWENCQPYNGSYFWRIHRSRQDVVTPVKHSLFVRVKGFFNRIKAKFVNAYYDVKYAYQRVRFGFDDRMYNTGLDYTLIKIIIRHVEILLANDEFPASRFFKNPNDTKQAIKARYDEYTGFINTCKKCVYYTDLCVEDIAFGTVGFREKFPPPTIGKYNKTDIDSIEISRLGRYYHNQMFDYLKKNIGEMWPV